MAHKKPEVSEQLAIEIAQNIFGLQDIIEVKELMSNYDRNFYIKTTSKPGNEATTMEFVLKFLNSIDSQYPLSILGEIEAMEFLRRKGFPCPHVCPVKNKESEFISLVDLDTTNHANNDKERKPSGKNVSVVRLITFLEGTMVDSIERNPQLMYTIGQFVGSVSKTLKDFSHKGITIRTSQQFKWNILEFLNIEKYITVFDERDEESQLIRQAHQLFVAEVTPYLETLRSGTVHNDMNGGNILITYPPCKITGLLDFGDMINSVLISDISNCMTFFMKGDRGVEFSGYVLAGYQSTFPLPANELKLLYYFNLARLCQLVMYMKDSLVLAPDDVDTQNCLKKYYRILKDFWGRGKEEIDEIWRKTELAMKL